MGRLLEIDVETSQVEEELDGIEKRYANDGEVMDIIAGTLHKIIDRNLAAETGGPDFGAWRPLAESTLKERHALGYGDRPILKRTGALYKAVSHEGALHTAEAGIESGAEGFYGKFHDLGGKLPQRSFVYFLEQDMEGVQDVLGDYYVDAVINEPVLGAV